MKQGRCHRSCFQGTCLWRSSTPNIWRSLLNTLPLSSLSAGTRFHFADGLDHDAHIVYEVLENNEVRVVVRALLGLPFNPVSNIDGSTPVTTAHCCDG